VIWAYLRSFLSTNSGKPLYAIDRDPGVIPGDTTNDDSKVAYMKDQPGRGAGLNTKWEFETCAVCRDGGDKGKVYGCITWGFTFPGEWKKPELVALSNADLRKKPSDEFLEALKAWNEQKDNRGKKTNVEFNLK
jgi:hypothetical protein